MKYILYLVLLVLLSCSLGAMKGQIKSYQRNYKFTDMSGEFILDFESGLSKKKEVYVKKRLIGEKDNKEYEKLITISKIGALNVGGRKVRVLRPRISQYTVWFEKQKYFSQLEIIPQEKILKIWMKSPTKEWNGVQSISFPNSRGIFCFFSQIVDCVKVTGFLSKAIKNKGGKVNLTTIWEGHPFISEQYSGIEGPLTTSVFSYEGLSQEGNFIFNLSFGNQVLFYHFNQNMQLEKKFWVSQGLEQIGI